MHGSTGERSVAIQAERHSSEAYDADKRCLDIHDPPEQLPRDRLSSVIRQKLHRHERSAVVAGLFAPASVHDPPACSRRAQSPYARTGALTPKPWSPCTIFSGVGSRRSRFWKRTSNAPNPKIFSIHIRATCCERTFDTKSVSWLSSLHAQTSPQPRPRRSPGPLRMLHAEPWVVGQGDVERADGS